MAIERRIDNGADALGEYTEDRTGALTLRYAPTWVGVREYDMPDGTISRELHRPEQVNSAGFRAQLARLPTPIGHPEIREGGTVSPVWLHVNPDFAGPGGYAVRAPRDYAVGWTGEVIEDRPCAEWPEISVPTVLVTVTDQRGIDLIRAGMRQSSLGYDVYVDRTPGVWIAPDGSEHPYDAEHVLDPDDPRLAAVPPEERRLLGPNHLALLPRGRGGVQSAIRWDGSVGSIPLREDLGDPRRFCFMRSEDVHGVSGEGRVADGVLWPDGTVTLRWRTETASTTDFASLEDLERVHGHEGRSAVTWIDPDPLAGLPPSPPEPTEPEGAKKIEVEVEVEIAEGGRADSAAVGKIGSVTVKVPIPHVLRRSDAEASISMPDDPEAVAKVEVALGAAAEKISALAAELMAMKEQLASASAAAEAAEAQVVELQPMADLGRDLDRAVSAEKARGLGVEPRGDTGPAIREAAVMALRPEALARYPEGEKRRVAVDAAFEVLVASAPVAGDKPKTTPAGLTPVRNDHAPAPAAGNIPAIRRFKETA